MIVFTQRKVSHLFEGTIYRSENYEEREPPCVIVHCTRNDTSISFRSARFHRWSSLIARFVRHLEPVRMRGRLNTQYTLDDKTWKANPFHEDDLSLLSLQIQFSTWHRCFRLPAASFYFSSLLLFFFLPRLFGYILTCSTSPP